MTRVRAYAAKSKGAALEPFEYEAGPLGADEVEVAVEFCGLCHSDKSVIDDEWGFSSYPCVPGHEVIGKVVAVGSAAKGVQVGQRVGVGWNSGSCFHCRPCLSGNQHLCSEAQATIAGHYGGFAERVRSHWAWAIPIPDGLDPAAAGPLLCGGITVFSPLMLHDVPPTAKAGVVGIGGLGHMALKFLRAWGCEVTAFTSESKFDEAKSMGAHRGVSSRDPNAIRELAGMLDLLLVTVNVPMDWEALLGTLAPQGRLHIVGAVLEPIPIPAMSLIMGQREVSGSPTGSPVAIAKMLEFAARHGVAPQTERYPMSRVNDAIARLKEGKVRYRAVLEADWK